MEIVDPEPDHEEVLLSETQIQAGKYWHYTGIALFAGFFDIAQEFANRAKALTYGKARPHKLQEYHFDESMILSRNAQDLIGVQWRPSDLAESDEDIWFYQAADPNTFMKILAHDTFPETGAYFFDQDRVTQQTALESTLPDGSYFGIGVQPREGLRIVDPRKGGDADIQLPLWDGYI